MDWAEMMLRMYMRYCEKKGFKVDIINIQNDTEAGIKSATLFVRGANAYGLLKCEQGVHRLVRISPFKTDLIFRIRSYSGFGRGYKRRY